MFESKLWLRFPERRLPIGEADTTKSLAPVSAPSGAYKVSKVLPPTKGSWVETLPNFENGGGTPCVRVFNVVEASPPPDRPGAKL